MNALAKELNEIIAKANPAVLDMLSELGKNLFMPKGIITQSAEAKEKAHKYNVTIGIATDKSGPMFLDSVYQCFTDMKPADIFPYAPSSGKPELRKKWLEKIKHDTPSLSAGTSLPIVTNALTHGLKVVSDVFMDKGDTLVLPSMFWGNYRLTFATMGGAEIATYNTFNEKGGFDVEALLEKCRESAQINGKIVVILNFPNNPSGYAPTTVEAKAIADGLIEIANSGTKVVAVTDDAYFGLFYEDDVYTESLFGLLAGKSDNLLAVKLDGSTKEHFVWGLRVGFITLGYTNSSDQSAMMTALEKKITGLIRGTISNCPHSSQSIMLRALNNTEFDAERAGKVAIMKGRAVSFKRVLAENDFTDQFTAYPFNSGYFMCLKLKKVDAEELRVYLLDQYGVGTISVNKTDLRLAFSCLDEADSEDLFKIIYKACGELSSK
ncbi:aminotransferase class I and II [Denitrovibrio acetiphilus DSM 12809]|uniref:Aminotransferase class I and II n=1 Tax=Denitrovibrio acetiphilus (strain DSM 12809 / NBRC 114555 / N2460) TaxID=522772 RepID=D4H4Z2_DENA2|nr:aminotransferase class I/II-fold pyridoxal phosphate-dependent enzyme [Denitrovibrio acetiphilus]ADD69348.1 aminotransferase class I and II [Denitrovibrio acetiphilus DSM 12809]